MATNLRHIDNPRQTTRLEVRHNPHGDWNRGTWTATLHVGGFLHASATAKRFDEALLSVGTKIPSWGEPSSTYDAACELPQMAAIMQGHKDWELIAETAGADWAAAFVADRNVLGSFIHERAYEAVVRSFNAATTAAGGAKWVGSQSPNTSRDRS
jgi:hypothetical protein